MSCIFVTVKYLRNRMTSMTDLKALEALARYMGYATSIQQGMFSVDVYIQATGEKGFNHLYHPATNAEQVGELLAMLIREYGLVEFEDTSDGVFIALGLDRKILAKGSDWKEAVTNCVLAVMEGMA